MSIRAKIIIIFSFISAIVVGGSSGVSYFIQKRSLIRELQGRILDVARVGAHTIDIDAYKRLMKKIKPDLTEKEITAIEHSDDYKTIYGQLNSLRDIEKGLIRYAYLMTPGKDENSPVFVVDADVLSLLEEIKDSGEASEEISHFAQVFDVSSPEMRFMKQAILEKKPIVEDEMTYDEEYNVSAISAYAPIYDHDGKTFLGILGIDMSDANIRNTMKTSTYLAISVIILSIIIAFIASYLSGSVITRGIIELTQTTKLFAGKNFGVRAIITTQDEVGQLGSSFNSMAQTIQDYALYNEKLLRAYGYFVPHNFLKLLGKESIIDVQLGDHVQNEMSILFSDIRAFTSLSESMSPDDNFRFINAYLSRVGPIIRNHNGIIDKYIGDAVMALFPSNPDEALIAAIQMQRKVREYNTERARANYRPIVIGIGIHTGLLSLGTVGESERMNGTVVSDAVNLASRLEGITKVYKSGIIISEYTLKKLNKPQKFYIRFLDKIQAKGKVEPVSIYEVFNGDTEDCIQWKEKTRNDLEIAINLYFKKDFSRSLEILDALKKNPFSDEVVQIYHDRCSHYLTHGVAEDWEGLSIMTTK